MRAGLSATALLVLLACGARAAAPVPPSLQPPDSPADRTLLDDTTNVPLIEADVKPLKGSGWVRQSASLLYYDAGGNLASELPLRTEDDGSGTVRERLGGAAPNGRFAWTLERTTSWNADRTKALSARSALRFFGDDGKELWQLANAGSPEKGEPVSFAADGETLLVAARTPQGWTVSIKSYLGATIMDIGPLPQLQLMTINPSGKYAMIRWTVPDQSATHTFVEIATKRRQDIPSSRFSWTTARVDDDGKVYAGKRLVFDFAVPAAAKPAP